MIIYLDRPKANARALLTCEATLYTPNIEALERASNERMALSFLTNSVDNKGRTVNKDLRDLGHEHLRKAGWTVEPIKKWWHI